MNKMTQRFVALAVLLGVFAAPTFGADKVLYVTHEPGKYHAYTPQIAVFKEIGKEAGWDVTIQTGEHEPQIEWLKTKNYSEGYDAIVYNFCFAQSKNLEAAHNLMVQTKRNGVPAMLIHCAMHSWWATYKDGNDGYENGGKPNAELVAEWTAKHPKVPFPSWGDFTGVASIRHGKKLPIVMTRANKSRITKRLPDGFTTGNTELYNNVYVDEKVVPLVMGKQGEDEAIVMWSVRRGKGRVIGFTIGHDMGDWEAKPFQHLIIDGVNNLMHPPVRKNANAKKKKD